MTLYTKNMELFKKVNPNIYCEVNENYISNYNLKLYNSDQPLNYIIEHNSMKCFLHSVYSVEDEMINQFKHTSNSEIIILFGIGMGKPVDYIKKNLNKVVKVIIVEPSIEIFKELIKKRDLHKLFHGIKDLSIILNKDCKTAVNGILSETKTNLNYSFVYTLSYRTIFSDYYNKITENVLKNIRSTRSDIITATQQNDIWLINSFRNLRESVINIDHIMNFFKDKPIILVSAGPSLNKNMHLLKEIKNNAIIVAVGTAIRNLENCGIKPHFRVAIDGTPGELKVFEDVDINDGVPLIHDSKFYYKITPKYNSPKFLMISGYGRVTKYIFNKAGINTLDFDSGPSVANITLNFLTVVNPSKIIIIGQDLCYAIDKNEMYAEGAENKQSTVCAAYKSRKKVILKDIHGNEVYSDNLFLAMKYGLERTAETNKKIKIINATEGGLPVDNINNCTLHEVINNHLNNRIDTDFQKYIRNIKIDTIKIENQIKINRAITDLNKEVQNIYQINNYRIKELNKIKKQIDKGLKINRIINALKSLETTDAELRKYDYYNKVIGKELAYTLKAIRTAFNYEGDDELEGAKSLQKILYSISLEIKKYCKITLELIEEYETGLWKENEKAL